MVDKRERTEILSREMEGDFGHGVKYRRGRQYRILTVYATDRRPDASFESRRSRDAGVPAPGGEALRGASSSGLPTPWNRQSTVHPMREPGVRLPDHPSAGHGPYYDWTRKVDGKTVTIRLTATQAKLVREWTARVRRFDRIAEEIQAVSAEVVRLVDK